MILKKHAGILMIFKKMLDFDDFGRCMMLDFDDFEKILDFADAWILVILMILKQDAGF